MLMPERELRAIVRVSGKDLDGSLSLARALGDVKGISFGMANAVAKRAAAEIGVAENEKLGMLDEKQIEALQAIVNKPTEHGIPAWMTNRRRDAETGRDRHVTGHDWDFVVRSDVDTMKKSRSYKGVRHSAGLTVRGQRTKTSGRKGTTIGVSRRKDVKGSGK
jgi:small subunit ribosomal protein S13